MRRTMSALLLLILCCTTLQAQGEVPEALQQRLVAFTDQVWSAWMKNGDIRSIASMRVPEIVSDPPCELIIFTAGKVCEEVNRDERADYKQTVDNVWTLMLYRILSYQSVFDWMASFSNSDSDTSLDGMFKSASFSDVELSLLKEFEGTAKDLDEFRRRLPRYKELEKMLQADHLRDFSRTENRAQYEKNIALLDQALKSRDVRISKVDRTDIASGLPAGGEYFVVPKGLFIFVVRVMGDEMRLAFAQLITK